MKYSDFLERYTEEDSDKIYYYANNLIPEILNKDIGHMEISDILQLSQ